MRRISTLIILFAVLGVSARADLVVNRIGGPTAVPGGYQWDYEAVLDTNDLRANDFFALYDFNGFESEVASTRPDNWDFTTEFETDQGPGPGTSVPDDPNVVNLRWTYTGATIPMTPGDDEMTFSTFSVISSIGTTNDIFFSGRTFNNVLDDSAYNLGETVGPGGDDAAIPEPASMMLLGGGLGALLFLRRRRQSV